MMGTIARADESLAAAYDLQHAQARPQHHGKDDDGEDRRRTDEQQQQDPVQNAEHDALQAGGTHRQHQVHRDDPDPEGGIEQQVHRAVFASIRRFRSPTFLSEVTSEFEKRIRNSCSI